MPDMGEVSRTRHITHRFILVEIGSMYLSIVNMIGDNAKTIILLNSGKVVLAKILPECFIAPGNLFLDIIAADQGTSHDFVQACSYTDITTAVQCLFLHRGYLFRLALRARDKLISLE